MGVVGLRFGSLLICFWRMIWMDRRRAATTAVEILTIRSQFLYVSALVFDFPGVDDTFVLLAV